MPFRCTRSNRHFSPWSRLGDTIVRAFDLAGAMQRAHDLAATQAALDVPDDNAHVMVQEISPFDAEDPVIAASAEEELCLVDYPLPSPEENPTIPLVDDPLPSPVETLTTPLVDGRSPAMPLAALNEPPTLCLGDTPDGSLLCVSIEREDHASVHAALAVPNTEMSKKAYHRKKMKTAARRRRRAAEAEAFELVHKPVALRHLAAESTINTDASMDALHPNPSAYQSVSKDAGPGDKAEYTLDHPLVRAMQYVPYDGNCIVPIATGSGDDMTVIAILAGSPKAGWGEVTAGATAAFKAARLRFVATPHERDHRRGRFPVGTIGISHGTGRQTPGNLSVKLENVEVLRTLEQNPYIRRLSGFASKTFAMAAPQLHKHYVHMLEQLQADQPGLRRNFTDSAWACACFNLGPQVQTHIHTDHLNWPAGWCSITALGSFDHRRGGHLVLWDLGLVVEFPAGSTVMIPSALLRHSNIPIQSNESRYSFVQWSAGALFRWVDQGCQPVETFREAHGCIAVEAMNQAAWQEGLQLLPKLRHFRRQVGHARK